MEVWLCFNKEKTEEEEPNKEMLLRMQTSSSNRQPLRLEIQPLHIIQEMAILEDHTDV